jgi:hypothetical protein
MGFHFKVICRGPLCRSIAAPYRLQGLPLRKGSESRGAAQVEMLSLMASKGFVFSYKGENIRFDPFAPVPLYRLILFLHGLLLLSCMV